MSPTISISQSIRKDYPFSFQFSICTLVTRKAEYEEMLASFIEKGFDTTSCEFLHIDNSEICEFEAYAGLNTFLQQAKGEYVILCHQDIILHDNNKQDLLNIIMQIEQKDPNWAILANAGGVNLKWIATHITEGSTGIVREEKDAPLQVKTVDENFIVVKKSANLALSRDLSGFHFYGTDLCLVADVLGYTAYTIPFNIIHKSNGKTDASFFEIHKKLKQKYHRAFRGRFLTTTFSRFYLSGNKFFHFLYNTAPVLFLVRQYYKFFTKKSDYKL